MHFLLDERRLVRANFPTSEGGHIHDIWSRLNFPLFYQADILFVLRAVADGRWSGASPFRQRTWRTMGEREETERWVSLQAAHVLQQAGYWQAE